MPTPEYCPNCGSFDLIIHEETAEEYRWCECKTCLSSWSEDAAQSVDEPDYSDEFLNGEYRRPDQESHPHQGEWL